MARGWESKAIEDQQQEAERRRNAGVSRESSATDRRRTLELARARTAGQLARAHTQAQREVFQRVLADLDDQLRPCREARRPDV